MMLTVIYVILGALGLSEALLSYSRRSDKGTRKAGNDGRSLKLIWVTILVSVFFAIKFKAEAGSLVPLGAISAGVIAVAACGSVIRWIAIHQLKDGFTVDVSIGSDHELKTDGIFKHVRHPSYTGLLMNFIGVGIAMNHMGSLLVLSIPILMAILYRIGIEENLLTAQFGEKYVAYMKATKRIIPFVV